MLDLAPLRAILDDVKKVIADEKAANEQSENRKEKREQADLAAQEMMATAAQRMLWLTLIQILVGSVTLGFLWLTFRETRRTADAGIAAAEHAARSVETSRKASEAAEVSAKASLAVERARFYIAIDENNLSRIIWDALSESDRSGLIMLDYTNTPPKVKYRIRNYGKTPGILKEVSLGMTFAADAVDCVYSVILTEFAETMIAALHSTETKEYSYEDGGLTKAQAADLRANRAHLWFFGSVVYDDVLGKEQTHRFYFRTVWFQDECILQPYDYKHYRQST